MNLQQALSAAKTEEDVKDAYVRAIGLKVYSKGQVDIQADNMWFEAKEAPTAAIAMFAQLLFYVRSARESGLEHLPPFLTVIDREKAAILETEQALPAIEDEGIDWPKAASAVSKKCIAQVAAHLDGLFGTFTIANQETEFLTQIKTALADGKIIRTPITPDNLRQVFNKWVEMVGRELWTRFHAATFPRKVRDDYRLGRADAGWYQIRKALEANSENDPVDFSAFKTAYAALGDKLRPQVFELGFLPQ